MSQVRRDLLKYPEFLKQEEYKLITLEESEPDKHRCGAHVVFYCPTDDKIYDKYPLKCHLLMMIREDGDLGFPGGIIDEGESILDGLNRETLEEIGAEIQVEESDFICAHLTNNHVKYGSIELHFYAKQVTLEQFTDLEKKSFNAEMFGLETFGITRVPLYTKTNGKGLPGFLKNSFAGNSKIQLLYTLYGLQFCSESEIKNCLQK